MPLQRKKWYVKNLDFDTEGRLVIYDKSLQDWFMREIVNFQGGSGVVTTVGGQAGFGGATVAADGGEDFTASNADCDVIVVGSCGSKPHDLDKTCDTIVVGYCGGKPPGMEKNCDTDGPGIMSQAAVSEDQADEETAVPSGLGVIIRDNSAE